MRWVIAAGIAGAVLEGIFWLGVFMMVAGVELNGPTLFLFGAAIGVLVLAAVVVYGLFRALRR